MASIQEVPAVIVVVVINEKTVSPIRLGPQRPANPISSIHFTDEETAAQIAYHTVCVLSKVQRLSEIPADRTAPLESFSPTFKFQLCILLAM